MAPAAPDWLTICRRIVVAQRQLFEQTPGIAGRTQYEGLGEGGDYSLVLDRRCEDVVFEELERLAGEGHEFVAVSEERGEVTFGAGATSRVVIDPIDGSLNARRTLPSHSLSIAVAQGDSMADVDFGYVYDFGAGEEFTARRGEGAWLGEAPLGPLPAEGEQLEVVGLEAAEPGLVLGAVERLRGRTYRLRAIGSIAITLSYVAAGRLDGMLGVRDCRSVDAAAAQLVVREAGALVAFGPGELSSAKLGLDARYPVAAARSDRWLEIVLDAQRAA